MQTIGPALLALALAAWAPAAAQDNQPPPDNGPATNHVDESAGGSMSLDDARTNFGTVIDAFIAGHSRDGYWPLKDKATGLVRRLKVVSKEPKGITPDESGGGRYIGRITLKDANNGERLQAEFLVDFSGSEWKVKQMRLIPNPKPKKKAVEAKPAAPQLAAPQPAATPGLVQPAPPAQAAPPAPPPSPPATSPPAPAPAGTPQK